MTGNASVARSRITSRLLPVEAAALLLLGAIPSGAVAGALSGRSGVPANAGAAAGNLTASDLASTDQLIVLWAGGHARAQLDRVARVTVAAGEQATWLRALAVGGDVYRLSSRLSAERMSATLAALTSQPDVASAEPDQILQAAASPPNDPYWTTPAPGQWDLSEGTTPTTYGIDLLGAWDRTLGPGVVVAVVDTGITAHPDLAGQTVAGYDFISDSLVANDGTGRDVDPSDPGDWITHAENASGYFAGCGVSNSSWHGTHVSGTIAALTNNGIGISAIAPAAKVQPVRVLGKGGGYLSDISDAIVWASGGTVSGVPANSTPARVINMSLGGGGSSCGAAMQAAIDGAVSRGTVVAVAAGNNNADASGFTPANCAGVVTVAATDRTGARASFSNYGSLVEIAAPGVSLWSTLNAGATSPTTPTYAQYSGTSMATPHVAGIAALVFAANPSLTPAQVGALLQSTAHGLASGGCPSGCGSGIVDAAKAVAASPPPAVTTIEPANGPPAGGTTVTLAGLVFTGATAVHFGATAASSFSVASDTQISAVSPVGTGTVDITVTGPGGTSPTSPADRFTYLANDFSIAASPASRSVSPGSSTTYTVSTAVTSGSAETVALSFTSGLPANTTGSFSPASLTAGSSSILTINTTGSTPAGTSTLTIAGTAPSATHATTASLTVASTHTVSGHVTAGGVGIAGAVVWAYKASDGAYVSGVLTGAGGSYSLALVPDSYKLWVTDVPGYPDQAYGPDGTFAHATPVNLSTADQPGTDIVMAP